jgi:uncharacterized protein YkwD
MKRALIASILVAALSVPSTAIAHDQRPAERRMSRKIQHARIIRNIPRLDHGWRLHRHGRQQVRRMHQCECVMHGPPPDCSYWGQNVGIGMSVWKLFRAFMDSDPHRANILNRNFTRFGVGTGWKDGLLYVAMEFCR